MKYTYVRTAADVLNTLKAYRDELHEQALRKPRWPLLDRLISRETEMTPVWNEIARHALTLQQSRNLLEQLFFAGAYGTQVENKRLKDDYAKLSHLNAGIATKAAELARMLTEREDILNRNAFCIERTTHLVDLIDTASGQNGHYHSHLRKPLDALRCQYDGKYWPSLQQILEVAACETPVAGFLDRSDEAVVHARGAAVPDFLRRLFYAIHSIRVSDGDLRTEHIFLPADFRLTDASLATLATVSLDLEEPASVDSVKMRRNALNKEGYPGAWATAGQITFSDGKSKPLTGRDSRRW
ncbi:hypothetical protein [Serratia marcescens]|uniref:hypothetical protein n=1 Tax=Serratia marcescens TaxID=615 RepID=UPI0016441A2A|nr:hypothetical protein [Serratia marcescens]HED1412866.1 hypothetical protein [Klebsiella pneumoniae]MDP8632963.1 hypothetical protein [Serratia marcescens]MDP8751777.1 hypothetical protein [Serratia marcescens]MDP8766061.1 hypothetical protein [Serratia marcescens]HBH7059325.1 hypothetical protein [Serratia marcescens]